MLKFTQAIVILGKKKILGRTDLIKIVKYFRVESPLRFISPHLTVIPNVTNAVTPKLRVDRGTTRRETGENLISRINQLNKR